MEDRNEAATANTDNVTPIHGHARRIREPQATDDELIEYRKLLPVLRLLVKRYPEIAEMLDDMDKLKDAKTGCPVMADVLRR